MLQKIYSRNNKPFQPSLMFPSKVGKAYQGQTLAFYEHFKITAVKCFTFLSPFDNNEQLPERLALFLTVIEAYHW